MCTKTTTNFYILIYFLFHFFFITQVSCCCCCFLNLCYVMLWLLLVIINIINIMIIQNKTQQKKFLSRIPIGCFFCVHSNLICSSNLLVYKWNLAFLLVFYIVILLPKIYKKLKYIKFFVVVFDFFYWNLDYSISTPLYLYLYI